MSIPIRYIPTGDKRAAMELKGFGRKVLRELLNDMARQNRSYGQSPKRTFADGTVVYSTSNHGINEVHIYVPPKMQVKEVKKEELVLNLAFYYRWYNEADEIQYDPLSYSEIILEKVRGGEIHNILLDSNPFNPIGVNGLIIELKIPWAYEIITDPHSNYFNISGSDGDYTYQTATQSYTQPTFPSIDPLTVCTNISTDYSVYQGRYYADGIVSDLSIVSSTNYTGLNATVALCGIYPVFNGDGIKSSVSSYYAIEAISDFSLSYTTDCNFYYSVGVSINRLFHASGSRDIEDIGIARILSGALVGNHEYSLSYGNIVLGSWQGEYTSGLSQYYAATYRIHFSGTLTDITGNTVPDACTDIPHSIWSGGYVHNPFSEEIITVNASDMLRYVRGYERAGYWTWIPTISRLLKGLDNNNKFLAASYNTCSSYYKDFDVSVGTTFILIGHSSGEGPFYDFSVNVYVDTGDALEASITRNYKFFTEIDSVVKEYTIPEILEITAKNNAWTQGGNRIENFTVSTNNLGYTYTYLVVAPGDQFTTSSVISPFTPASEPTKPVLIPTIMESNLYWQPVIQHNTDKIVKRVVGFISTVDETSIDADNNSLSIGDRYELEILNNAEDLEKSSFVGDLIFWEKSVTVGSSEVWVPVSAMVFSPIINPGRLLSRAGLATI